MDNQKQSPTGQKGRSDMFVEWSGNKVTVRHDNRNLHRVIFARREVQCAQINGDHVAVTYNDGHTALYDARSGNLVRQ